MIVVTSRFKVRNGLEAAVREAFVHRPHRVERAPGLLGVEVFTDATDVSVFVLVTRWTDHASYHRWHASDEHRLSHVGIPEGLKLDPTWTEVRELDRIEDPVAESALETLVRDEAAFFARHLRESVSMHVLVASLDGTIRAANVQLRRALGATALEGTPLWPRLSVADATSLRERVARAGADEPSFLVNFVRDDHEPFTLEARLLVRKDAFVLAGEPPSDADAGRVAELSRIADELAARARENERLKRDLETSHWHIRKIQELLPLCLECGRVKTRENRWDSVLDFLRQNTTFLSHGYCPACYEVVLARIKAQARDA